MSTAKTLTLSHLTVSVAHKTVVNNLNLTLQPGQIHCLMGPNGSGKSSLGFALMGHPHYQVTQGDIILEGKSIRNNTPDERAHLGLFLAFQYPVSIPGVSVQNALKTAYESIHCTGCTLHPHCPKLSVSQFRSQLLNTTLSLGLSPDLLTRPLNDGFSGGEKKRVEMLTLLTLKPKFAILDETDSGLDVDSIKLVAKAIKHAAQKEGIAVLLITHYRRLLEYVVPQVVSVMLHGQIVKSGGPVLLDQIEKSGYQPFV